MAELGARAYRFSVSWPRVLPDRDRRQSTSGPRLLRPPRRRAARRRRPAAGQPVPLGPAPGAPGSRRLRQPGGRRLVHRLHRAVASALGDRVTDWMTFNEPAVFAFLGHADGIHAPGLQRLADGDARGRQPAARPRRRDRGDPRHSSTDAKIGVAIDVNQVAPATDSERDRRAAEQWSSARDAWFLDPLFGRGYPKLGLEAHARGPHGGRRARRPARRRPRLPRPQLLPARLGRRQVGPRVRWDDRGRGRRGADADGLARRAGRPARRPDRAATSGTRRARSWSPRTGPPTPTPWSRTARCTTPSGWTTSPATSPRSPMRSTRASRSRATTSGRSSTTTSGASGYTGGSAWSTSTSPASGARPRTARTGTSG